MPVPDRVVFDAEPLVAHAADEPGSETVEEYLDAVAGDDTTGHVSCVNLAEIRYIIARRYDRPTADEYLDWLDELGIETRGAEAVMSAVNGGSRTSRKDGQINGSARSTLMLSLPTLLRVGSVMGALAGLVHIAIPNRLLELASCGYDRVLAVRFQPQRNATRRVRPIGVAMVASAPVLARLAAWME
ncbi:PIN domain-containing protein [Haloglomus irregulare]|jgi:hypothetical protein|nr:hypothetical protein [Haloglomus irregulare]